MIAFTLSDRAMRDRFWKGCFEIGLLTVRCGERSIGGDERSAAARHALHTHPEPLGKVHLREDPRHVGRSG